MSVPSTVTRELWAGTITLAAANTPYHIIDLVNAALQAQAGGTGKVVSGAPRYYSLTAYSNVDGSGANTNDVLIGDSKVSSTNWAWNLAAGSQQVVESPLENTQLAGLYAIAGATNQKLCVIVMS